MCILTFVSMWCSECGFYKKHIDLNLICKTLVSQDHQCQNGDAQLQQAAHVQIEVLKWEMNIYIKTCHDYHFGPYGPQGLPENLMAD